MEPDGQARAVASPAYAGIDPRRCRGPAGRRCLPRVRGDRPSGAPCSSTCCWPPPRTRGSTPDMGLMQPRVKASPAYAGIDPAPSASPGSTTCLPRVRGDRPLVDNIFQLVPRPPPRTRGSTQDLLAGAVPVHASPAYAGIDPTGRSQYLIRLRLPRVRGDRPYDTEVTAGPALPPPRTRGSTLVLVQEPTQSIASPAYAGIDPTQPAADMPTLRLPRVRGDRPATALTCVIDDVPPPRTRGSTLLRRHGRLRWEASPAYAGIDPCHLRPCGRRWCLPRVRGDRPCIRRVWLDSDLPPPRTRGSTRVWLANDWPDAASPAYAGIDLQ